MEGLSKRSICRLFWRESVLLLVCFHFFERGEAVLGRWCVSKMAIEVVFVFDFDIRLSVLVRIP